MTTADLDPILLVCQVLGTVGDSGLCCRVPCYTRDLKRALVNPFAWMYFNLQVNLDMTCVFKLCPVVLLRPPATDKQCTVKFKRFVASSICLCISCCRCDLFPDTACITEGPAWCVLYSVAFSPLPSVWSSADGQQLRHRSSTASYPTTDPTKALEIKQTVGFQVNESMLHSHCAFSTNAHLLLVA